MFITFFLTTQFILSYSIIVRLHFETHLFQGLFFFTFRDLFIRQTSIGVIAEFEFIIHITITDIEECILCLIFGKGIRRSTLLRGAIAHQIHVHVCCIGSTWIRNSHGKTTAVLLRYLLLWITLHHLHWLYLAIHVHLWLLETLHLHVITKWHLLHRLHLLYLLVTHHLLLIERQQESLIAIAIIHIHSSRLLHCLMCVDIGSGCDVVGTVVNGKECYVVIVYFVSQVNQGIIIIWIKLTLKI